MSSNKMGNKNCSNCLEFPLNELVQKVFDFSHDFCLVLTAMMIRQPRQLQLHLKLVEKETKRFICLDKVLLLELYRQLNQFLSADIQYPCSASRDLGISVKMTKNSGEYKVEYEKTKIILDSISANWMMVYEKDVFNKIRDMEDQYACGHDEIDL